MRTVASRLLVLPAVMLATAATFAVMPSAPSDGSPSYGSVPHHAVPSSHGSRPGAPADDVVVGGLV